MSSLWFLTGARVIPRHPPGHHVSWAQCGKVPPFQTVHCKEQLHYSCIKILTAINFIGEADWGAKTKKKKKGPVHLEGLYLIRPVQKANRTRFPGCRHGIIQNTSNRVWDSFSLRLVCGTFRKISRSILDSQQPFFSACSYFSAKICPLLDHETCLWANYGTVHLLEM